MDESNRRLSAEDRNLLIDSVGLGALAQIQRFEERCPNGRITIRKRPLRMALMNGRSLRSHARTACRSENSCSENAPETAPSDPIRSLVAARPEVRQTVPRTTPLTASKGQPAGRRLCTDGLLRGTDQRICRAYFGIDRSLFVETAI